MVQLVEQPGLGQVREMGIPVMLAATPGEIKGPAPRRGQHTRVVLEGLGYSAATIQELQRAGVCK